MVTIIVVDEETKSYTNFGDIDKNAEMEIRKNVNQYNDKYGVRYVVRWGNDESYLKANGYTPWPDVYGDMVNNYNTHLTASEPPMRY